MCSQERWLGMDIDVIVQLIGSVGFPIACCVYLISSMSKKLDALTEVIHNNNLIIQQMIDKDKYNEVKKDE